MSGGATGIYGKNTGSGDLYIKSTGSVTGTSFNGITALNYNGALTIKAATVTGGSDGIYASNYGGGDLSITTTGPVVGGSDDGVNATTQSGALSITTMGTVTGGLATPGSNGSGIYARNYYGSSLTIKTYGAVTGSRYGVFAIFGGYGQEGQASGVLSITANGPVTGMTGSGIRAVNYGQSPYDEPGSSTSITVTKNGFVQGKVAGITAISKYNQAPITITNNGTVQNLSGLSTDLAIRAYGGPTTVINNGTITGVVDFRPGTPTPTARPIPDPDMINNGIWNTAGGTNNFSGGGSDTLTNTATGVINAANSGAASPVTTTFNGLATFTNAGLITMNNGVPGNLLVINADFVGQGGSIGLGTQLGGDNSRTDQLIINGNASGTTHLLVYNEGGLGAQTTNGIQVVTVNGAAPATAFSLGQPVEAGAYAYTLVERTIQETPDPEGFFLVSTLTPPTPTPTPTPPAILLPNYRNEVPVYLAMPELANQLGFAMVDNFDARMGGGREAYVLPGPMAGVNCEHQTLPTHKGCSTPAEIAAADAQMRLEAVQKYLMWARVIGETGEQEPGGGASVSFGTPFLNGKGPQYSASYGGFQAGMDLYRRINPDGSHDDAGLYVGYLNAHADVDQVYSSALAGTVNMNAYSLGAYWTHFGAPGWYVDAVLQGTWLGQVEGSTPLTGMSVNGSALAASLEAGYPFHFAGNWTIEPQGQLIYQYTELGSGNDLYGHTSFGDTNDVRGRIGAKLSYVVLNGASGAGLPVTLWGRVNLFHDFLGSAPSASFSTLSGLYPVTLDGTLGGTYGQIDAGVDARMTKTVSVFGSAFYDHSIDGGSSWSAGGRIGVKVEF